MAIDWAGSRDAEAGAAAGPPQPTLQSSHCPGADQVSHCSHGAAGHTLNTAQGPENIGFGNIFRHLKIICL